VDSNVRLVPFVILVVERPDECVFYMVGAVLKRKSPMSFDDEDPILKKRLHNALAGLGQW